MFVSLGLLFSCGTTKVEPQKDEQTVVEPLAPENDDKTEEDVTVDSEEKKDESTGERKHRRKPKKVRNKKIEEEEEVPAPVIPLFDDWKYMGFGTEVPKEVEEAVKAAPVDFIVDGFKVYDAESRNVVILHTSGLNVDQAESKLEISVSKSAAANVPADISLDDYEASESGWVRLNLEYFADKLQAEDEGNQIYQALIKLLEQTYIAYQIFRKK